MKTILFFAALLLNTVGANCQEIIVSPPIPVKGNYLANSPKRFCDERYFAECETSPNRITYFVFDREQGSFTTLKCQPILRDVLSSTVIQFYVYNGSVYELSLGSKAGKSKFVVTKRSIKDEESSEQVWSYERNAKRMSTDRMAFYMDSNGAYLVSTSEDENECFIERLDANMKSAWKKTLKELQLPQVEFTFRTLSNGTVLMQANSSPVSEQEIAKGGATISKTQMRLLAVENNDEIYCINPQVNHPMAISNATYSYNSEQNEFTGLLLTHEVSSSGRTQLSGQGFAFYRWDKQGTILQSSSKNLTYGDVLKAEDKKTLGKLGIAVSNSDSDPLPAFEHPLMATYSLENGGFVIHLQRLHAISGNQRDPFGAGGFILKIKGDGTIGWSRFIPAAAAFTELGSCQLVVSENKVHFIYLDYKKNAGNSSGIIGVRESDREPRGAAVMHFDLETGQFSGIDALDLPAVKEDYRLSFLYSNYIYSQIPDNTNAGKCVYLKCSGFKSKQETFYNVCFE